MGVRSRQRWWGLTASLTVLIAAGLRRELGHVDDSHDSDNNHNDRRCRAPYASPVDQEVDRPRSR